MDIQKMLLHAQDLVLGALPTLFGAVAVLVFGWIIIGYVITLEEKFFKKVKFDETLETFLVSLSGVGLKIILLIIVIGMLGVQTSSLVALLGAMGLAVGLALQGSLANFAGGVLILIFKPFKVGDMIEAGGHRGVVRNIEIFNTILRSPNKEKIVLPNGELSNNPIVNITGVGQMGVEITFGIGYGDDIDQAKSIIKSIVENDERVLKDPSPIMGVRALADSSVNIFTRSFVKPTDYWDVLFDLTEAVKKEFDANNISIPFPQQDVHMHQVTNEK